MIYSLARDAVRWEAKQVKKSRAQKGGPWTPLAVVFCIVPVLLAGLVGMLALHGHLLAALVVTAVPSLLLGAVAGLARQGGGSASGAKVLEKYQDVPEANSAQRMRQRAELLSDVDAVNRAVAAKFTAGPDPDDWNSPEDEVWDEPSAEVHLSDAELREAGVQALYAVPCPEPGCLAPVSIPCMMGTGIPVALVSKRPVKFCHIARVTAAAAAGTVTREEVLAQFGAGALEGVIT